MPPIVLNLRTLLIPLALVLLGFAQVAAQSPPDSKSLITYQRPAQQAPPATVPQPLHHDRAVSPANFEVTPSKNQATSSSPKKSQPSDPRQLAPPSPLAKQLGSANLDSGESAANRHDVAGFASAQIESLATAGTGLAIVIGLFFVCMWLMRRSGPKPTTPLPKEAVAMLGRVPLAARNFAHLIQVGNKLVLVAITPDGVTPITEVTDPEEVDRLLGLCLRNHKHSSTAEFHNVLQQLASEPAKGFLGKETHAMSAGLRR